MGADSKIEWCHHTWNPWVGCTRVSPACDHCYAEAWAARYGEGRLWQGERRQTSAATRRQPLKWNKEAIRDGVRRRVFCGSLMDFADNQVPPDWRQEAWQIIDQCRQLDWMLLTKRPQNYLKMLPEPPAGAEGGLPPWGEGWPNVWLGTTVEDRKRLINIDHLRKVPARIRFLSIEPLLEDLGVIDLTGIDLVIVGGESGPDARPLHPAWVLSLLEQCLAAGVAFFFKQWGEYEAHIVGPEEPSSIRFPPGHVEFRRVGKKFAGRKLYGQTWDQMPGAF